MLGASFGGLGSGVPLAFAASELRGMRLDASSLRLELSAPAVPTTVAVRRSDGSLARVYVDFPPGLEVAAGVPRQRSGGGTANGTLLAARLGRSENGGLRVAVEVQNGAAFELRPEAGGRVFRLRIEARPASAGGASKAKTSGGASANAEKLSPKSSTDAAKASPPAPRRPSATTILASPPGEEGLPSTEETSIRRAEAPARTAATGDEPPPREDDQPAKRQGTRRPDAGRIPDRPRRLKVVLDPGHGGSDPGASGYAVEKYVTLAIANRLAERIRERLDVDVVLTRTGDETLELKDRTAIANAERADLFVSIHANASPREAASGIETYLLDDTTDRATLRLAAMENQTPVARPRKGQTDLVYILSDLVQGGKVEESDALARAIQRGLVGNMRRRYSDVVDLGVKRGPFYVLVGAHMPCVLVETAFLTNPIEGRRLADEDFQDAVAEGIYAGIAGFLADAARSRTL